MAGSGFRPAPQVNPVELDGVSTGPDWTGGDPAQPFNVGPLRPSKRTHDEQRETTDVDADLQAADVDDFRMWWEQGLARDTAEGRPRGWKLTPTARAVVGVAAIIGTVLALKGGAPSSDLFAFNGPAHTQFPDDKVAAQSSNAASGQDSAQSAQGKVAKEPVVDLSTQASPALPADGSEDVRKIPPAAGVSNPTPVAQAIDTSPVASLPSQPPSTQSPDLRSARTISPTSRATVGAVETARPSGPKLDMPTKHPGKLTNRVAVASAETTASIEAPVAPTERLGLAKPAKPEEASAPKSAEATAEPATAQPASPEAAKPPLDPLLRALGGLFGVRGSPAPQPIDPTPTSSTGWAVQLATSRTEVEATSTLKRLNTKYASALNGSTIRLRKARVDGETVYGLPVAGLSKSEAEALCSRLKGDGGSCFIVR